MEKVSSLITKCNDSRSQTLFSLRCWYRREHRRGNPDTQGRCLMPAGMRVGLSNSTGRRREMDWSKEFQPSFGVLSKSQHYTSSGSYHFRKTTSRKQYLLKGRMLVKLHQVCISSHCLVISNGEPSIPYGVTVFRKPRKGACTT